MYYSHIIYKHEPLFDFLSSVFDRKKKPHCLTTPPPPTQKKNQRINSLF